MSEIGATLPSMYFFFPSSNPTADFINKFQHSMTTLGSQKKHSDWMLQVT